MQARTCENLAPPLLRAVALLFLGLSILCLKANAQELVPLGCDTESSLKSITGDTPTAIQFINDTSGTVLIYWLDYSGKRVQYATLLSKQSYVQQTYLTHPWVVTNQAGACLAIFMPLAGQHIARIVDLTISQNHELWWLCGEQRLPTSAILTVSNSPTTGSFEWKVAKGSDKVSFGGKASTTTTKPAAEIKSLAASEHEKDVQVTVTFNSTTVALDLSVLSPTKLKRRPDFDSDSGRGDNCDVAGNMGYESHIGYELFDQFDKNAGDAGINEKFGKAMDTVRNNWKTPREQGSDTPGGTFLDRLCRAGDRRPQAQPPQNPLTDEEIQKLPQTWFAGDDRSGKGCKVQTDKIQWFIDHGRHIDIVSPVK